jgi:DNA invertase Pin-like site-specific DNA recombinase
MSGGDHDIGRIADENLVRERTQAGLAAARARGRVGGRPTVWTPEKLAAARAVREDGEHDVATIARVLGVSRASVYRGLRGYDDQL